jgi:hypothetical protein
MLREKPPLGNDGFSETSSAGCLDNSENSPIQALKAHFLQPTVQQMSIRILQWPLDGRPA